MRTVALTNISSAANQGVLNPNAPTVANNMSLNVAAQAQISQIASDQMKTMSSEKTISSERRSEPSFDNKRAEEEEKDEGTIGKDQKSSKNGSLLAVA